MDAVSDTENEATTKVVWVLRGPSNTNGVSTGVLVGRRKEQKENQGNHGAHHEALSQKLDIFFDISNDPSRTVNAIFMSNAM